MNTFRNKLLKLFVSSFLFSFHQANAGTNPSIAKLNIYGVAVAANSDCSNAKVIGYSATGTVYDMLTNPAIVSGSVSAGTYNCVVLIMDAALTFTPASGASGSCTAGTSYDRVLCRAGSCNYTAFTIDSTNIIQYGSSTASLASSTTDLANKPKVLLFLTTSSTGNGQNAFLKPTDGSTTTTNGLPLSGAFAVASSGSSGTFVVNFDGQIDGSDSTCDLRQPSFSFR